MAFASKFHFVDCDRGCLLEWGMRVGYPRWKWLSGSPSTRFVPKAHHVSHVPRQRDTHSDYCIGKPPPPPQEFDHLVDFAIRNESKERERDELERHVDTFSDELELVEPTTLAGRFVQSLRKGGVLHPQSYWHLAWLLLVSACFVFNCVAIPLRSTFPYQTPGNAWLFCDLACDAVYLLDLLLVKPHLIFVYDGFWVRERRLTRKHYFRKWQFKMDILSLAPLDLLYLKYGKDLVLLRLPRILKIQTFWELFDHLDSLLMSPYLVRVARTLCYMMYLVHLNACGYYAFSAREGLGTNNWTYKGGEGNAYIRCFYFATKTATSVGKNPRPETEGEYLFMTCSWLMGVFVFALLIGQVRDIVATASKTRTEHRKRLDETLEHMRGLSLPDHVQRRVQSWFSFADQHQPFDEAKILNSLPQKLKTDVALDVHGVTLSKVHLFNKIADQALIRDLVLKLRSVIYLPGDFICRKNEVGKEMYIVKTGQVEVLAPSNGEVLATLSEGSVFGEISLLALAGGNRRTADVRSKGFSNLFVLSKNDLQETLEYYPDAQEILKQKAEALMQENADRERRESRAMRGSPDTTDTETTTEDDTTTCPSASDTDSSGDPSHVVVRIRVTPELLAERLDLEDGRDAGEPDVDAIVRAAPTPIPATPEEPARLTTSPPASSPPTPTPSIASTPACCEVPDGGGFVPSVHVTPVAEQDSDLTSVTEYTTCSSASRTSRRSSCSSACTCTCTCSCSCSYDCGLGPSAPVERSLMDTGVAVASELPWNQDSDDDEDGDTLSDLSSASILSPMLSPRLSPSLEGRQPGLPQELQRRRVSAPTPTTDLADRSLLVPHRLSFPSSRRKGRTAAHRTRSHQ